MFISVNIPTNKAGLKNMANIERLSLLHKVATLYYEKGLKKYDIANEIKQSPTQVGLLLKEAIDEGIIKIEVQLPRFTSLQESLKNKFGLQDVIVVPFDKDFSLLRNNLSKAGAKYFEENVQNNHKIAVGGGYLTYKMIEYLEAKVRDIDIYSTALIGRDNGITHIDPMILVNLLWAKCGHQYEKAHYFTLTPPNEFADNIEIRKHYNEIKNNNRLTQLLLEMNNVDYVFTSIGSLGVDKTFNINPNKPKNLAVSIKISEEELKSQGVVGDIVYSFFGSNGHTKPEWSVFPSIEIETLKQMSKRENKKVVVTAGYYKSKSLKSVLENKMCNVLITDTYSAELLLSK
jgi:deoxyribonucleoside regulator